MENLFSPTTLELTIEDIVGLFKNYSDAKRLKDIKDAVKEKYGISPEDADSIEKVITQLLKEDKALGNQSNLTYTKGKYKKRKGKSAPKSFDYLLPSTDYVGRAGECAVMSELMFRGYNANRMMIDEGVDIIAVKNNMYYYVQVKTTTIKEGKIYCQINVDRYDEYIGKQIRYIIVARYKDADTQKNMFFTFSSEDIEKGIYGRYIKRGDTSVSIKIKFNEKTGEPELYDEKECSIGWNLNRFEL
jgi:hypothetical protein